MTIPELTLEQEAHAQELAPALAADLLQMTRRLASQPDDQVLGQTEFQIRDLVHKIGAKTLQAELDARQKNYQGSSMICPHCRDVAAFQDHRDKTFTTLPGDARVTAHPSDSSEHCPSGAFPGDEALGLTGRRLSHGAEPVITRGGTLTSFGAAAGKILPKMTGLHPRESSVARVTPADGARLGRLLAQGQTRGAAGAWEWYRDATGQTVASVSVEATGVGQQGPGGVPAEGKMVYVGRVFNPAAGDPEAPHVAQPIEQARSLAGLTDLEELGTPRRRQAGQVGRDRADQGIGLSDGGQGREGFFKVPFPRATLIVDFSPAAGHLADLAQAWSDDTVTAEALLEAWRPPRKDEGGAVVRRTWEPRDRSGRVPDAREEDRLATPYVRKDADRMDDPRSQAQGWQMGAGSMESGCTPEIGPRHCGGGMRWGVEGRDSESHLRALFPSASSQCEAFGNRSLN